MKFSHFTLYLLLLKAGFIFSQNSDSSKLTLLFAGDIMGHVPQFMSAYDSAFKDYNYEPCFRYIKPFVYNSDIAIANLEVTLSGPPYTGYPRFSSPDELAYDIKNAGFSVVVTANNHCYDKGKTGFKRTLDILDSIGIEHLGTYIDSVQRSKSYPLIIEKKGIRLALFNYTYGTNGLLPEKPNIINYISKRMILSDLTKADSEKADYKIAIMHWGKEYEMKPNNEQKELALFLSKQGFDAIIGSHPHVVQTFEILYPDTTDSTHFVPVFYSLGNFISNQRNRYCDGGAMFSFTIEKNIKTHAIDWSYQPYWVYRGTLNEKFQYYIIPPELYECQPDSFVLSPAEIKRLKEFDDDTQKQLQNIKKSEYFKCEKMK